MNLRGLPKELSGLAVLAICATLSMNGSPVQSAQLGDFGRQSPALAAEDEKGGASDSSKTAKEKADNDDKFDDSNKKQSDNNSNKNKKSDSSTNSKSEKTSSSEDPSKFADRPVTFSGNASWYGIPFHGRKTANGETFNMYRPSAAHLSLPLPTKALVEDPRSGNAVIVRVNDRGPYVKTRVMDLSREAARNLGTLSRGVAFIEVTVLEKPIRKSKKSS